MSEVEIDLSPKAFSPKQLDYIGNSYAPINIAVGAVQSGKSWVLNVRFALYIIESPHDRFLICGNTRDTVQDNVIENGFQKICEGILGKENVHYAKGDGKFYIWVDGKEKVCTIVGVNNKGATNKLKGKPVGGSLLDEITTYPEEPLDMAFARNSLAGAIIFASSNPDSPLHPVYVKYVGNQKKIREGKVRVWNFNHDDNPTLTEERKEFYRDLFSGVFYQRNILGKWVMAEGAIYDMYLSSENEIGLDSDLRPSNPNEYYDDFFVCCDYGTGSVTTYLLVGVKTKLVDGIGGKKTAKLFYDVIREYYYDSRKGMGVRYTDPELVVKLKEFITTGFTPKKLKAIFVDVSAASFIAQCFKDKVEDEFNTKILASSSRVDKGISNISTLIAQRRLKYYVECKNAIREIQSYSWDTTKRKKGESVPIKENDHTCDAIRYGIMGYGGEFIDPNEDQDNPFAVVNTGNKILG